MTAPLRFLIALLVCGVVVALLAFAFHYLTSYKARLAVVRLQRKSTEEQMASFLQNAVRDQPIIDFAQQAFRALAGELIFIDGRLQKTLSTDIPVYDLKEWNIAPRESLPRIIEVGPEGIAVKFEHPGIWYEMVFSSRRGYGTLQVRRYMLAAVANRVEELLITQQRLHNYRARS